MTKFAIRNLRALAYSNGFTLWFYRTGAPTLAEVSAPQFFAAAADMLAARDMISVSGDGWGAMLFVVRTSPDVLTAPMCATAPVVALPMLAAQDAE